MVDEKRKDELERRIGDHQLTQLQHLITLSDSYQKAKNGIRQEVALSDNKKTVSDKRARYQTNQNVIRQSPDSYQTTSSRVSDKLIKSKTGLPVSPIGQFWIPRDETGSPKRMSDRRWRVEGGPGMSRVRKVPPRHQRRKEASLRATKESSLWMY